MARKVVAGHLDNEREIPNDPDWAEIDIMEHYNHDNIVVQTAHNNYSTIQIGRPRRSALSDLPSRLRIGIFMA